MPRGRGAVAEGRPRGGSVTAPPEVIAAVAAYREAVARHCRMVAELPPHDPRINGYGRDVMQVARLALQKAMIYALPWARGEDGSATVRRAVAAGGTLYVLEADIFEDDWEIVNWVELAPSDWAGDDGSCNGAEGLPKGE